MSEMAMQYHNTAVMTSRFALLVRACHKPHEVSMSLAVAAVAVALVVRSPRRQSQSHDD